MNCRGASLRISQLKTVVKAIGSPFNPQEFSQLEDHNPTALYELARKNKVGLLFLESIPSYLMNEDLEMHLEKQRMQYGFLQETLRRVASILEKNGSEYAVIKSNYPFRVVPNDIDILIFGNQNEYLRNTKLLTDSSFEKIGEAPLESCFHDTTRGIHKDPKEKDPLDVDMYREVGAGHIIYMDKNKVKKYLSSSTVEGQAFSILMPPAELALSIFHSIFPERVYTLLLHYQILYCVAEFSVDEFFKICKEHRFMKAARFVLSLTELIQDIIFGSIPNKLSDLRDLFGDRIKMNIERLPYNYSNLLILSCFWNKVSDYKFSTTLAKQAMSMLNFNYARYVLSVYEDRRKRETY